MGQPLTGDHRNVPHEAEVVKGLAVLEAEKMRNITHAAWIAGGIGFEDAVRSASSVDY